jgi:hypothetical protein
LFVVCVQLAVLKVERDALAAQLLEDAEELAICEEELEELYQV